MTEVFNLDPSICDDSLTEAFELTIKMAEESRYEYITPEMLLYTITHQTEFQRFCNRHHIDAEALGAELYSYISSQDKIPEDEEFIALPSIQMTNLISYIEIELKDDRSSKDEDNEYDDDKSYSDNVTVPDVISFMYELDDNIAHYCLSRYFGDDPDQWIDDLYMEYGIMPLEEKAPEPKPVGSAYIKINKIEGVDSEDLIRKLMESASQVFGSVSSVNVNSSSAGNGQSSDKKTKREPWEDLVTCINDIYMYKNPLVGRVKELERTIRILCRKDKNNPLYIGEPGVGKTAIIYGLAKMIEEGRVPEWLKGQKIYALDMSNMVAGASYHGEFEKRMKMVLEGAKHRAGSIIYIDEIHNVIDTGGGNNSMNAAEMLKPYLEDGTIRFIGCTTYQEYNKSIANKKAIARRFGLIDIKEPSADETVEIINALLPIYEQHHGVKYTDEAVRYAVMQTDMLINDRCLPDKAIDIIDEAGAYLQQNPLLNKNGQPKAKRYQKVDRQLVKQILTEVCRIDARALTSESNDDLRTLDSRIRAEIYGQDDAIRHVVRSVMMSKAGLNEPNKPIASLLFVGPTGVGKTEVCKVLAQQLGIALVRFDMSEYTEKHTISKLIGSPAGYVGYDEGGLLTDAIRKNPSCVLLLDEIEKAHSDIYNILLQVMDYARLTDNKGNKIDFKNVILVMTSNAGAQYASQACVGFGKVSTKGEAMLSTVKKTFKPEFINRLSGTVVFNEMDETMATLILDKKIRQLAGRLTSKGVMLTLTDAARQYLLHQGYTREYGAREMDRAISQYLTPLLMDEMLFGRLKKGGEATADCEGENLVLKTAKGDNVDVQTQS